MKPIAQTSEIRSNRPTTRMSKLNKSIEQALFK